MSSCDDVHTGPPIPASVAILPENPSVQQGGEIQLSAAVLNRVRRPIPGLQPIFRSSHQAVLTISPSGLATSIGPSGTAYVTATYLELSASAAVTITQRASSMVFNPDPLVINRNSTEYLRVTVLDLVGNEISSATRRSLNSQLVQTSPNGFVEAGGMLGTTGIEVTSGGLVDTVEVIVTRIPTTIDLQPRGVVLRPGDSRQISAPVRDAVGEIIPDAIAEFSGSTPGLFDVTSGGLVTSLGPMGTGTVEVSYADLDTILPVTITEGFAGLLTARTFIEGAPYGVAISDDGDMVVTRPELPRVLIGTLSEASFPASVIAGDQPLGLDFTPDGTMAYIALKNGMGRIDLTTNSALPLIGGFQFSLIDVKFSPEGDVIYAGGGSQLHRVSATTHEILGVVPAGRAYWILPHPTLARVYVSHNFDGAVVEHDAVTLEELRRFTIGGPVQGLALHPDGTLLVAVEGPAELQEWDLTSGMRIRAITLVDKAFGVTVAGNRIVVTLAESGWVQFLDVNSGMSMGLVRVQGRPRRPATSADGSIVVIPNEGGWVDFFQ